MELKNYFNTTKENVKAKKHNIIIPLCLGNRFFMERDFSINEENISQYLTFALENTKDKVLLLIADKIQVTNYDVRTHNSKKYNRKKVLRDGIKVKNKLENFVGNVPIIQWEDYEQKDPFCDSTTNLLYNEFKNNTKFRNEVLNTVKTSVTDRKFSEDDYLTLCNYILDEFSLAYSGTVYNGVHYDLYIYPFVDSTVRLIDKIQKAEIFPELNQKLPKEKMALAILN